MGRAIAGLWVMAALGAGVAPLSAQHGLREVPLSVDPGGALVVPVATADGRTLRFALHTAIPTTMVAATVAGDDPAALGLTLEGDATPFADMQAAPDGAFQVGGERVDGFLALHTLGDVDILLDAPRGRMVLKPLGRRVEWAGVALSEPARMRIYHGVALRLEIEVEGEALGATLDLGSAANVINAGGSARAGVEAGVPAAVRVGASERAVVFDVGTTPVLDRWDPDGTGFVAFGAALAADCAVSISFVHQELRSCVR